MIILEYKKPNGNKITINMYAIASVEQMAKYAKIILTTGHEHLVTEHASTITVDIEHALKNKEYDEWAKYSHYNNRG